MKKDMVGLKFGKLKVVNYCGSKSNRRIWVCVCECGNIVTVNGSALRTGNTKSCGCMKSESIVRAHYTGGKYISGWEFGGIKRNALIRGIKFDITVKDIEDLYEKQNRKCIFTGKNLVFDDISAAKKRGGKINRGNASVDRIDSTMGYDINNIQLVDKEINRMKWTLSNAEFIQLCRDVTSYGDNKQ